jgi:hypothetical protein
MVVMKRARASKQQRFEGRISTLQLVGVAGLAREMCQWRECAQLCNEESTCS